LYLRVADCIMQAGLVSSGIEAARRVNNRLGIAADDQKKLLTVHVAFNEAGVPALDPPPPKFKDVLSQLWAGFSRILNSIQPVSREKAFKEHTVEAEAIQKISKLLASNRTFQEHIRQVEDGMVDQLIAAESFVKDAFEPNALILEYYWNWSETFFNQQEQTFKDLVSHLQMVEEFKSEISKIRSHKSIGVMVVDAKQIREDLLSRLDSALAATKHKMQKVALKQCLCACKYLDVANKTSANLSSTQPSDYDLKRLLSEVEEADRVLAKNHIRLTTEHEMQLAMFRAKSVAWIRRGEEATHSIKNPLSNHGVAVLHVQDLIGKTHAEGMDT